MANSADACVPQTLTDFVFDLYDSVTLSQLPEEQGRLYNTVLRELSAKVCIHTYIRVFWYLFGFIFVESKSKSIVGLMEPCYFLFSRFHSFVLFVPPSIHSILSSLSLSAFSIHPRRCRLVLCHFSLALTAIDCQ